MQSKRTIELVHANLPNAMAFESHQNDCFLVHVCELSYMYNKLTHYLMFRFTMQCEILNERWLHEESHKTNKMSKLGVGVCTGTDACLEQCDGMFVPHAGKTFIPYRVVLRQTTNFMLLCRHCFPRIAPTPCSNSSSNDTIKPMYPHVRLW